MKVFIVIRGENGEGGTIQGVFTNAALATVSATKLTSPNFGPWRTAVPAPHQVMRWISGCDELVIEQWDVRCTPNKTTTD